MLPFLDDTDEFLNYWILRALALIVIYLAWRSTYVREDRTTAPGAVLVIENNLRRINAIQHSVTTIILRSSSQQSNISNVTETEELDLENDSIASSIDNITQSILTEASESATGLDLSDTEGYTGVVGSPIVDSFHDPGPEEIIRQMDATDAETPAASEAVSSSSSSSCELRQRKNATDVTADGAGEKSSDPANTRDTGSPTSSGDGAPVVSVATAKPIRIKLKYLNDDSKLVEGNLNEGIGEFKKRNFTLELNAHKLVRLVFNGHVLQPDSKTLAACGLFDNCVVHCLIHNQKSSLNGTTDRPMAGTMGAENLTQQSSPSTGGLEDGDGLDSDEGFDGRDGNGHPDSTGHAGTRYGTYFIYIGTLAVTAVILYGWYCRFHYGHLFNLNSTIGLIVTTTTFLIMMPTIILADSNTPN